MSRISRFIVVASVFVVCLAVLICWSLRYELWPRHHKRSGDCGGYNYSVIWRYTARGMDLNKLILVPRFVNCSLESSPSSRDNANSGQMIYMSPTCLKVWTAVVDTSKDRVFVFSDGNDTHAMLPIELTADEMRSLTPEGIDALPTTQLWKEKIEPVLEANEGKRHRKPNVSNPSVNLKNAAATIN